MNRLKTTLAAILLAATMPIMAKADDAKVIKGYNAVETAMTDQADVRTRVITNIGVVADNTKIAYNGMNEMNNYDAKTFFGNQRLMIADADAKDQYLLGVKTDKDGAFDTKVGARLNSICPAIGADYGRLDVLLNQKATELALFCGKVIGKGATLEVLYDVTANHAEKPAHYVEIQLNKEIARNTDLMARMETFEFKTPTYMLGITKRF